MKIKYLFILLFTTLIYSCDDATTGIGNSTIAGGDSIPAGWHNPCEASHRWWCRDRGESFAMRADRERQCCAMSPQER